MNKYFICYFDDGYAERGKFLIRYSDIIEIQEGNEKPIKVASGLTKIAESGSKGSIEIEGDRWRWSGTSYDRFNLFTIEDNDITFEAPDDESAILIFECEDK